MIAQALANIVSMGSQEVMQEITDGRYGALLKKVNKVLGDFLKRKTAFFVDSRRERIALKVLLGSERIDLDHLPDGLRSIIAWLFATIAKLEVAFPDDSDPLEREFIMILDEPETHLHPAWQRYVLRIAQELFPNAQFIVATHSPFIISSINRGWIHILNTCEDDGLVYFGEPQPCSEGDTYMDAVEDVLGIKELYDPETEDLLAQFRELRQQVLSNGFEGETELRSLMMKIGARSKSLENMMGRELFQLDKAKQMAAAS
ncbi:AAA family ATPase [Roseibacillus ishigakijimensis]|uniref:AAA family ATPase n=1 Tax=Roseibacillus ishigakijimensis TaxID=454146 RepID=A0A934RR46_9BACT|nr:AAA family ATPase [Roseibacillus ishigakijimensis]MBK1833923.1 AAA family ATPase [Roseibacillus ishigakijimensis]